MLARLGRRVSSLDFSANLWLFFANTLLTQVGLGMFNLVFNLHLARLGLREDYIGVFWFANTLALGASALPASFVSNRLGPRWCIVASSFLIATFTVALALFTSPLVVVAGGVLLGASTSLLFVPGGPFMMDNCDDDNRLRVFSVCTATVSFAAILGSLMSGYLPAFLRAGLGPERGVVAYPLALLLAAVLIGAGAVPMLFVRARARPSNEQVRARAVVNTDPLDERAARAAFRPIAISCAINSLAAGLIVPFYNVFLTERQGASVETVGVIFAAASLLMIPTSLVSPLLVRRLGTVGAVALPRVLIAPFILLPVVVGGVPAAAITHIVRAAMMNSSFPTDNAYTLGLMPPRLRAVQAAVRTASWNSSWAVASLVAGQAIVVVGYPAIFVASAVLHVAAGAYYYFGVGRLRPVAPSTEPARAEAAG